LQEKRKKKSRMFTEKVWLWLRRSKYCGSNMSVTL